ncbi:hypothetical protein OVS_02825 [Mycoplasma ovis str. Michigan]|uniref:Uncharacterized protein n=1 Tax=Mycoplasma ovis str. Michigan TaxID=1415773 RepID=A0ABM5P1J9_9MOLU|nr:hypothetical protein [Mycoplasma ovis]AHC40362.1 hypothetical protein OVS_02825 [Mycoplasma ovis str. Michigan]
MRRKFKWFLAAFLSSFSPAVYVSGDLIDSEGILSITTEDIEDWIQVYNDNLTWPNDYKNDNSGAFLVKTIGLTNNPKGIVVNKGTQYLKNRQLGIQVIGKIHRNRWLGRRDIGSHVSPYEVVLTSVSEDGKTIKHERLDKWAQNIHVIEWEGVGNGSEPAGSDGNENYKGVMAVSFLPDNELKHFVDQFDEWDSINVQDIDVRDILKKTVKLDHDFGNMTVSDISGGGAPFMSSSAWYKTSNSFGQVSNSGQEKTFAQEVLSNTDWMKRHWYKGEELSNETTDESWETKEVEIQVPEKYYVQSSGGGGQQVEFSEDEVKGIVKVESESDGSVILGKNGSGEKITVGKNDLSVTYWINRRNMNIVRRVIKELLKQEKLEDLQLNQKDYSYSDLENIVKKKFILDKFRKLDSKCSGNLIDTDEWITVTLDSDLADEEDEEDSEESDEDGGGGEEEEDLFAEEKFCDEWEYPKVKGTEDPELLLTELVWQNLKTEVESELTKLRKILKEEMKTYLNSWSKGELNMPAETVEKIHQICGKNLDACEIKPKTTKVTEYKLSSEQSKPEQRKSIKDKLISLPDKFGVVKSWNYDKQLVNPLGAQNGQLVPIVWTIQGFSQGKEQKPWSKSWNSNDEKELKKEEHKKIKITKIKEWR